MNELGCVISQSTLRKRQASPGSAEWLGERCKEGSDLEGDAATGQEE